MEPPEPTKIQWLKDKNNLPQNAKVGVDPLLLTSNDFVSLSTNLERSGIELVAMEKNLVDEIWNTQPEIEFKMIKPQELEYSGLKSSEKIKSLREALEAKDAVSMLITSVADVACEFKQFLAFKNKIIKFHLF